MNIQNRKKSAIILLFVFIFSFTLSVINPRRVEAQLITFDPANFGMQTSDSIWTKIQKVATTVWNKVASVAFTNALRGFATTLAQDAANYLAEGGAGRKSLMQKKPWDTYFKDAGKAATAQFLDDVASGALGLDVCQPPTIGLNLNVAMSLKTAEVTGNKPRCSLDDIYKKWGDWGKNVVRDPLALATLNGQSLKDVATAMGLNPKAEMTPQEEARLKAELLSKSFSFQGSDVEFINNTIIESSIKESEAKYKAEVSSAGYKEIMGSKTAITGELKTPAQYGDSKLKELTDSNKNFIERTEDIAVDTLNIFANTFITKRLERFVKEQLAKSGAPQEDIISTNIYSPSVKTKSIVDEVFATINKISLNINPRNIDIISEMEMDLGSEFTSKINNGTIDSKFAEALRRAETDPLSLSEAIDNNLIDDSKYFGFTNITSPNIDGDLPQDGSITYANIKKLRRNRVVPVGWELAALQIQKLGQSGNPPEGCNSTGCSLKTVMNGYDDSGKFKVGDVEIKDNYCGWRPIESYLSYNELNGEDGATNDVCSAQFFNLDSISISGLKFKTDTNHCYKYTTDSDGVVISRVDEYVSSMNESSCEDTIGPKFYREWVNGGCFAIEEDESPFCHLVDPNWILKAPEQKCVSEGYYSALESSDSSNRYKDCADIKNCIKSDDKGNCLGYGYCLKEKNIWRFRGDNCNEKFAGCTRLKDDTGKTQSYILDTLKGCSENEAGCKGYSIYQKQDEPITTTSTYHWDESYLSSYTTTTPYKTILLNKNSKSCDKNSEGCSKFIELKPGANLVPNGSFEINEDNNVSTPDGWNGDNFVYQFGAGSNAVDGVHSVRINSRGLLEMNVSKLPFNILNKGLYTLSYYVKKASNGQVNVTPKFIYTISGQTQEVKINEDAKYSSNENADSSNWIRKTGYFSIHNLSTNALTSGARLMFEVSSDNNDNTGVYIDAVQFEINKYIDSNINSGVGEASAYSDYGKIGSVYFKKAPEYYGCNAGNKNDAKCAPYIKYCDAQDNGCEAYKPANGDPLVTAIPEQGDLCPSECNNYQTFSQQVSYFESIENLNNAKPIAVSPVDKSFIPESAKDCPANEESCELFTNIDKLEKGAEAKEYYNFIRQCVKPEESPSTIYYTWEGSDTSGFQLKTWKLLQGSSGAPCTNVVIGGNSCNSTLDANISDCNPDNNYDCRVFYDKNAKSYYRLLSKTIPITEECIDLRREGSENNPKQIYKAIPSLSKLCSASNVGCRKYKGNKGDNIRNVFTEGFESGTISGWGPAGILGITSEAIAYNGHSMSIRGTGQITITYNITDSGYIINPNRQYTLGFWAKKHEGNWIASSKIFSNTIGKIIKGLKNTFYKDVNAADNNTNIINDYEFTPSNGDAYIEFSANNNIILDNADWSMYKYTAVLSPQTAGNGKYFLKFTINIPSGANGLYIDNINLKEITADFYKVKDSWDTPSVCSSNIDYIGCSKYQDKTNQSWYFYKFSNLCKAENIGCTAMIDTKNSDMPYQQTFNAYCKTSDDCVSGKYYYKNYEDININNRVTSTLKISQDNIIYVIKDTKYLCNSSNKGCSKMGFIDNDSGYTDVYKINNPDSYIIDDFYGGSDQTLCLSENKDCVGFSKSDGGMIYKIHPRDLTCEYKEKDGDNPAGFYKKGTSVSCNELLYNTNYNTFVDNVNNVSDNYLPFSNSLNKYAALCPDDQDKCSLFIDPNDNVDVKDIVKQEVNYNINLNSSPLNWFVTNWNNSSSGSFSTPLLPIGGNSSVSRYGNGLKITVGNQGDSIMYRLNSTDLHGYDFAVQPGEVYALSANVRMDGRVNSTTNIREYITTFLSCKPSNKHNQNSGYLNANQLPYAYPSIRSNYSFEEKNGDSSWHNINGLYKISNEGEYCNIVFNFHGKSGSGSLFNPSSGSVIYMQDIKLERISGTYYYKDNDALDRDSCEKANIKDGCILFNNTSKDGLSSNSELSYSQERLVGNDSQYPNDSNDLLKVVRDRECGEWATCSSQIKTKDPQTGKDKFSCVSLIACNKLSESQNGDCDNYIVREDGGKPLTLDYYNKTMGMSTWSNLSYSGYSIPGIYPIDVLGSFTKSNGSYGLGHGIIKRNENNSYSYRVGVGVKDPISDITQTYNNDYKDTITEKSCRLYPEKDSPFTVTDDNQIALFASNGEGNNYAIIGDKDPKFSMANICQPSDIIGTNNTCDCSYSKANYGVSNLYFPYDFENIPEKINIGGTYDSIGSETTNYSKLKSVIKNSGWSGYCLDYDKSLPIGGSSASAYKDPDKFKYRCSTWYPVDSIAGEFDSTTYAPQADVASQISATSKMCMLAEDYTTTEDRVYCGKFVSVDGVDYCNILVMVPSGSKINTGFASSSPEIAEWLLADNSSNRHWLNVGEYFSRQLSNSWNNSNPDSGMGNNVYPIIHKFNPPNVTYGNHDTGDQNEEQGSLTVYKFTKADFKNVDTNIDMEDISSLFYPTGSNVIKKYIFDENVNTQSGVDESDAYIWISPKLRIYKADNSDFEWNTVRTCLEKNGHEVYKKTIDANLDESEFEQAVFTALDLWGYINPTIALGNWILGNDPKTRIRYCNPYLYNYYINIPTSSSFYDTGNPCNATTCAKKCKVYAKVGTTGENRTVFKANNFYLTNIARTDFSSQSANVNSVCNFNGTYICSGMRSGDLNYYNDDLTMRSKENHGGGATWHTMLGMFGINTSDTGYAKPILHGSNYNLTMSGASSFFDFFANQELNETISTVQSPDRLGRLIVKIPSNNFLNASTSQIVITDWDLISDSANNGTSIVKPIISSATSTQLGFSVDGKRGQNDIISGKNSANVNFDFYGFASADKTPIMQIKIDWNGDNTDASIFTGPFKNRKYKCERFCGNTMQTVNDKISCSTDEDCISKGYAKCFSISWGDTPDACIEDIGNNRSYFSFNHVYTCNPMMSGYYYQACPSEYNINGGCCIYTPTVTIKDNWSGESTYGICGANNTNCHVIIAPK